MSSGCCCPLLRKLDEPPVLVGYCLGGTMALAAAGVTRVAGLATDRRAVAFRGLSAPARERTSPACGAPADPVCEALGLVPMEVLQSGFWRLDPARTIAKYETFGRLDPDSDAARGFVALEDWANAGAPLTYAAGRQLFEDFFADDAPGTRRWRIAGTHRRSRRARLPGDRLRLAERPHRSRRHRRRPARPPRPRRRAMSA